jgi:uncharacterized protein (DUF58 family)
MSRVAPTALLDPAVLAGIDDLALLARTVVDGFVHGLHRSRQTGLSLDFAQHRVYQPGDDLRRIDWRLFGRTDRLFLKTYEAETNADLLVALDVSGSMDFGSGAMTKFAYARAMLASLAWLARRQGDRVGMVPLGGGDLAELVPPGGRHLPMVLEALARLSPKGEVRLGAALERLSSLSGRTGVLVIASDCYDDPSAIQRGVGALRARGWDVALFHVLDRAERDFGFEGASTFADLETQVRLAVEPTEVREAYQREITSHVEALSRLVGDGGADYLPITTDAPMDVALRAWLDRRHRPVGG